MANDTGGTYGGGGATSNWDEPANVPQAFKFNDIYDAGGFEGSSSIGGMTAGKFASGNNSMLYQWGVIQFEVMPLNLHEAEHESATAWAHKDIAGASIYREWVGENDESLMIHGRLFPYRIGGMSNLELFESTRRLGQANMLIRGDGSVLGWFVCEKLLRTHTILSGQGVGQMIAFEAHMSRVPVPSSATYLSAMWDTVLVPGG